MANRIAHDAGGFAAGMIVAAAMAGNQSASGVLLEYVGGGIGGLAASRLPDIFDPPVSPRHRDVAHAVVPVGAALAVVLGLVREGQEKLRAYADSLAARRAYSQLTDIEALLSHFFEWLARLLAGALAGVVGGYLSHLALDSCTPAGLPIFAGGI